MRKYTNQPGPGLVRIQRPCMSFRFGGTEVEVDRVADGKRGRVTIDSVLRR
jgi:hypothetical protein